MLLRSALSLSAFSGDRVVLLFQVAVIQLIHIYFMISNYFYFPRKLFLILSPAVLCSYSQAEQNNKMWVGSAYLTAVDRKLLKAGKCELKEPWLRNKDVGLVV